MRLANATLALALSGSILVPASSQAAPAFVTKAKTAIKERVEHYKNFRAAKAEVSALKSQSADMQKTYSEAFKAAGAPINSTIYMSGGASAFGMEAIAAKGALAATVVAHPVVTAVAVAGTIGVAAGLSKQAMHGRVAVLGKALSEGRALSPRAREYFTTHAEKQRNSAVADVARTQEKLAKTQEKLASQTKHVDSLTKQIKLANK